MMANAIKCLGEVQHVNNDILIEVEEIGDCVHEVNNSCCCGGARLECKLVGESEVWRWILK